MTLDAKILEKTNRGLLSLLLIMAALLALVVALPPMLKPLAVLCIILAVRFVVPARSAALGTQTIEAREREVVLGGERHEVRAAYFVPRGSFVRLVIDARRVFDVSTPTQREASALLDALGFARSAFVVEIPIGMRVTVGSDGVLVEWRLLRKRRFLPFSRLTGLDDHGDALVLYEKDKPPLEIGTLSAFTHDKERSAEEHTALAFRIGEARAAFLAAEPDPDASGLLARAGRSPQEWLRALVDLARGDYRRATLPKERLLRVALDPSASPDVRAGAAVAARAHLDERERSNLRVAAESAASPLVRATFEAALEGDEDDLARELARS